MDGLRWECQPGCTNCCNVKGYVYLTEDDLRRAATFLGLTPEEFELRYIYRTKHLLRFRKPASSQCHFLTEGGCSIHPAKPTQCSLYPFWPELVEDRKTWNDMAVVCPGIGKGKLIQIGAALERAEGMRRAYPAMYSLDPID